MDDKALESNFKDILENGDSKYDKGQYKEALSLYKEIYSHNSFDKLSKIQQCQILLGLMKTTLQLNRLKEAGEYFGKGIELVKNPCDESMTSIEADFYAIDGKIYMKEEKYNEAITQFNQAIELLGPSTSNTLMPLVRIDIAEAYIAKYDYENAEIILITSLIQQLGILKNSSDITNNLHSDLTIPQFYESQRPEDDQLEQLKTNLKSLLSKKSLKTLKIALLYDTIGSIFYLHSLYKQAVECYQDSEKIKTKLSKSISKCHKLASVQYLSKAYFAYAESDPRQWEQATIYYKKWRSIIKQTIPNAEVLSVPLMNILGEIAFRKNKFAGSHKIYQDAKKILKEAKDLENVNKNIEMSTIHYNYGRKYLREKEYNLAMKYFQMSLKLVEEELKENNKIEIKLKAKYEIFIADIKENIANVHRQQKEVDSAKQMYQEAIKIRKKICNENDLDFARSFHSRERLEKYRRIYDQTLPNDEPILKEFKMIDKACLKMGKIYQGIAEIYQFLGERERALSYYREALDEYIDPNVKNKEKESEVQELINTIERELSVSNHNSTTDTSSGTRMSQSQSDNKKDSELMDVDVGQPSHPSYESSLCEENNIIDDDIENDCIIISSGNDKDFESIKNKEESVSQSTADRNDIRIYEEKFRSEFNKAMDDNKDLDHFINNILFIGPEKPGKSHIFNVLSHHEQNSSPENASKSKIINLNNLLENNSDSNASFDISSLIDRNILSVIRKHIGDIDVTDTARNDSQLMDAGTRLHRHLVKESDNTANRSNISINSSNDWASRWHSLYEEYYRKYRKYRNKIECQLDEYFANIRNYDNYVYYQAFKRQHNIYIAPFDINIMVGDDYKSPNQIDYIKSFEEWIRNIIDWGSEERSIEVKIDDNSQTFTLPVIILVALDSSISKEGQWIKRDRFLGNLWDTVPFHNHCYCPKIVIETAPKADNTAAVLNEDWRRLIEIMKQMMEKLHQINPKANMSSYLAANLLYEMNIINTPSQHFKNLKEIISSSKCNTAQKQIVDGLKFLRNAGEVILFQHGNLDNSDSIVLGEVSSSNPNIVIANANQFNIILHDIFDLDAHSGDCIGIGSNWDTYRQAKILGIISNKFIKNTCRTKSFTGTDTDIHDIFQAIEWYGIGYPHLISFEEYKRCIRDQPHLIKEYNRIRDHSYFVPMLKPFHNKKINKNLSDQFLSEWLYVGINCKNDEKCYITDRIFYHSLSLFTQKGWNVNLYHYGACYEKYEGDYGLNLQLCKDKLYIKIQYSYQKLRQEAKANGGINVKDRNNELKQSAIDALRADEPHVKFRKTFAKVIKKLYSKKKIPKCQFHIPCSECNDKIYITEFKVKEMKCVHCLKIIYPVVLNHWDFEKHLETRTDSSHSTTTNLSCQENTPPLTPTKENNGERQTWADNESLTSVLNPNNNSKRKRSEESGSDTEQYHEAPTSPVPSNDEISNTTSFSRNKSKQARFEERRDDLILDPKSPPLICSEATVQACRAYRDAFLSIVPIDEILDELKVKGILSRMQTGKIKECSTKQQNNEKLFEILVNERSDQDFYQFIEILKSNTVATVKVLGEKLERKATKFRNNNHAV